MNLQKSNSRREIFISFLAVIGVLFIWWIVTWLSARQVPDLAERGQFGDSFGVVNSLFTGLAFAGLLWTFRMQHQDSKEQERRHRQEIESQRDAAKEQEARHRENLELQGLIAYTEIAKALFLNNERKWEKALRSEHPYAAGDDLAKKLETAKAERYDQVKKGMEELERRLNIKGSI